MAMRSLIICLKLGLLYSWLVLNLLRRQDGLELLTLLPLLGLQACFTVPD